MTTSQAYQYVALRCVPRPEREEFVNVGVVLYCQASAFLDVAWHLDRERLSALDSRLDLDQVGAALDFAQRVSAGDPAAGGVASQAIGVRFGFLKAPRSTVVQPGPVHGGVTADPARQLDRLLAALVTT